MIIRRMTLTHHNNGTTCGHTGGFAGRSAGIPSTTADIEFSISDPNEARWLRQMEDIEVRLVPAGKAAFDWAFALFALDHAGEKTSSELTGLRPGLLELWAQADDATRTSYQRRADLLGVLALP